jgi:hypothetical protein
MGINGLHDSTMTNLNLRYSPQYYHFVANSTNVIFDNINIAGGSVSNNVAKNTDGWDTYRSSDLTIQNSHVNNGDGELKCTCNRQQETDYIQIASPSSPIVLKYWCKTCSVMAHMVFLLDPLDNIQATTILLRMFMSTTPLCTTPP